MVGGILLGGGGGEAGPLGPPGYTYAQTPWFSILILLLIAVVRMYCCTRKFLIFSHSFIFFIKRSDTLRKQLHSSEINMYIRQSS